MNPLELIAALFAPRITLPPRLWTLLAAGPLALALASPARATHVPTGTPDAVLDLGTAAGIAAVKGTWRYHDVRIEETTFRSVGADLKPSGPPNRTYDIAPHAGTANFDDSAWERLDPATLAARRGNGRVSFNWYRIAVTVPDRVGDVDVAGTTLVLETVVDDYAEVWVDGVLARTLGQRGGSVVAGWNAPNRVVLARDAKPGRRIQVALFGINGPISDAPANYIWIRSAKLEFHRELAKPLAHGRVKADVKRLDPALDGLIPRDATIEKLADGFQFAEGPAWTPDGALVFSDPNTNVAYRWTPDGRVRVEREKSGYEGDDFGRLRQPGSNGLAFDAQGRLTLCEHGNRRVTRIEPDGKVTVLADRYKGRRLNSPNDLVYRSDGALYFTDPPFGLPGFHDDPAREAEATGVYCLRNGELKLVSDELRGPNGIALSPDEKHLYVANWDEQAKIVMRWDVLPDGTLRNGRRFFDMGAAPEPEALDGLEVDARGNLWVSGPGGVWVISPAGKHLGTIRAPELPANLAWGDADRRTLYFTARTGIYRMRVAVAGAGANAVATQAAR